MAITELMKAKRVQRKEVARGAGVRAAGEKGKDPNAPEDEELFKELEWPLVRKMLAWMLPHKKQYGVALLLSVIFTVLEMLGPMFIRQLIDHDVKGEKHWAALAAEWVADKVSAGGGARLDEHFAAHGAYWSIGMTVGLWALVVLSANLINRFNIEYNRRIGEKVMFAIRKALFVHL